MSVDQSYNSETVLAAIGERDEWNTSVDALSLCAMPEWCAEPLVHELIFSMFLWESTIENAQKVMGKIHDQFVDYNELRVCFPHEIEALLGSRYQRAEDRSIRLIESLRAIFDHHQMLTLEPLREMGKREARDFLSSIEALPRFVVSRVMLLGLEAHALPLDAKIARALHKAGLIANAKDPDNIASTLERSIRANQTLETYTRLERWLISFESGS
ncbi:MAG: hypothetical protein JJ974_03855 [Phycisphaerales bacterium]|nr:hypothetical protein [Phycisphaerales bacterium]